MVSTGPQGMTRTTPWEVPDWQYDEDPGYYVHSGHVYISGRVTSYAGTSQLGSATLFTGIPPELAPEAPFTSRVLVDHTNISLEYAADSLFKIGPWLLVTISPDGTATLDDWDSSFIPSLDDFSTLSLILSGLNWPTGSQIYDAYGATGSLDDWIANAANILAVSGHASSDVWFNIDGSYSAHDERLHLNGKVELVTDYSANPYDALIGIPFEYQAKKSAEGAGTDAYLAVQRDGYIFQILMPFSAVKRSLGSRAGSQNPAGAQNGGCGYFDKFFFEKVADGTITRGMDIPLLSFTPASTDVDVTYQGFKGSPVRDLPPVADWRGNRYSVELEFTIDDLIATLGPVDVPFDETYSYIDYNLIEGVDQFSFIMVPPGSVTDQTYYKVTYVYNSFDQNVYVLLFLEQCSGSSRGLLSSYHWLPAESSSTPIRTGFSLLTSPNAADIGTALSAPGYNYWQFFPRSGFGGFVGTDFVVEPINGGSLAAGNAIGDMGFHFPSGDHPSPATSFKIFKADISGIGTFPPYAEGDVIDFTDCGWPLI
jgi:hypothetical protein